MARTTDEIIEEMDAAQAAETELAALNSPSQVSIFKLWKFIVATITNQLEQLWDIKKVEIESLVESAIAPSEAWLRRKALEFQYDAVTPQIITLNADLVPTYPVIDLTKRIITRASVKTTGGLTVEVKVAKNEPPVPLSVAELAAFQDYYTSPSNSSSTGDVGGIGFAGVAISCISVSPDLLYLKGTIYHDGQYSPVIQTNVIVALDAYLAAIPFDGVVKVVDLVDAIQAVTGVTDLKIEDMSIRDNGTPFGSGTDLINSYTLTLTKLETVAGYVVQETTAGQTFADQLIFTAI